MRQLPSADVDPALVRLRVALLEEEVGEFVAASERGDLIAALPQFGAAQGIERVQRRVSGMRDAIR